VGREHANKDLGFETGVLRLRLLKDGPTLVEWAEQGDEPTQAGGIHADYRITQRSFIHSVRARSSRSEIPD
jgi:hypothetical protein